MVVKKAVKARKAKSQPEMEVSRIGGNGGITKDKMRGFQKFYGNAIRATVGDLEAIVNTYWAVYWHSISTDDASHHDRCPKGASSWCRWQQALALKAPPPPH